jgi:uncharacterized protein YbbC (DUF1343 family)
MKGVMTGLDLLGAEGYQRLRGQRVGLLAHAASVDRRLRHAVDLLQAVRDVKLVSVFGPEHGWLGQAQDLEAVGDEPRIGAGGPRIVSLYGDTVESLRPTAEQLAEIDVLVIDLQDIGSRYYTYQATMLYCLEAAHAIGLRVVVLDRPNPIDGLTIEGPALAPGHESFIGPYDIAVRHGMTLGELARLYQAEKKLHNIGLEILPCSGWERGTYHDETRLPWVMTSPNMPTVETATVYPGQCLFEGTNLSEGRGTTRPFELIGAPWLDARALAARLNGESIPGAAFRATVFNPTFQKHAGKNCGGVQLHVTNRRAFQPVRTGLAMLEAIRFLSGERFVWRSGTYEFVSDPIAFDLLIGSSRERLALEAGTPWREIVERWKAEEAAFAERRAPHLIYR